MEVFIGVISVLVQTGPSRPAYLQSIPVLVLSGLDFFQSFLVLVQSSLDLFPVLRLDLQTLETHLTG